MTHIYMQESHFGLKLIQFCKTRSLRIANGRLYADEGIGEYTYIGQNGCSVIDYMICMDDVLSQISDFSVDCRTESWHMPVRFSYAVNPQGSVSIKAEGEKSSKIRYVFDDENIVRYQDEVTQRFDDAFRSEYLNMVDNPNESVTSLVEILTNQLRICGEPCLKRKSNHVQLQPVRFDVECRTLKYEKNKYLRKFRRERSEQSLANYLSVKKQFSDLCLQQKNAYYDSQLNELISCSTNSSTFWNKLSK